MPLSSDDLLSRVEIERLIAAYSHAVDAHEWDLLDQIFLAECLCDFTEVSDFVGNRAAFKEWLSHSLPSQRRYYHMMGASHIVVSGHEATAVTPCINPMPLADGGLRLLGHWYRDDLIRTDEGWRIQKRYLEFCWSKHLSTPEEEPFQVPWRRTRS